MQENKAQKVGKVKQKENGTITETYLLKLCLSSQPIFISKI